VFGVKDALTAWAFGVSFIAAGGLVSVFGPRPVLIASGAAVAAVTVVATVRLRNVEPHEAGDRVRRVPMERPSVERYT
jgi:hypothetical protein